MTPDPRMDAVVRLSDLAQIVEAMALPPDRGQVMRRDDQAAIVVRVRETLDRIAASRAGVGQGKPSGVEAAVEELREAVDRYAMIRHTSENDCLHADPCECDASLYDASWLLAEAARAVIAAYDAARTNTAGAPVVCFHCKGSGVVDVGGGTDATGKYAGFKPCPYCLPPTVRFKGTNTAGGGT